MRPTVRVASAAGTDVGGSARVGRARPGRRAMRRPGSAPALPRAARRVLCENGHLPTGNDRASVWPGGAPCVNCPGAQSSCQNGQCVCVPHCQGNQCGPDGCGGSCVTCPPGATCTVQGHCMCPPTCPGPQVCCSEAVQGAVGRCVQRRQRLLRRADVLRWRLPPADRGERVQRQQRLLPQRGPGNACCGGTCCFSCEGCNPVSNTCVGDPAPGCPCVSQSCPSGQVCCGELCCVSGRQCCGGQCRAPNEC